MRKAISIILICILLSVLFISCSTNKENMVVDNTLNTSKTTTITTEPTSVSLTETTTETTTTPTTTKKVTTTERAATTSEKEKISQNVETTTEPTTPNTTTTTKPSTSQPVWCWEGGSKHVTLEGLGWYSSFDAAKNAALKYLSEHREYTNWEVQECDCDKYTFYVR